MLPMSINTDYVCIYFAFPIAVITDNVQKQSEVKMVRTDKLDEEEEWEIAAEEAKSGWFVKKNKKQSAYKEI